MLNTASNRKWLEAARFEAQPYGLTDFTEVAAALGENQPIRHPFFAGQPITSATVNLPRACSATLGIGE